MPSSDSVSAKKNNLGSGPRQEAAMVDQYPYFTSLSYYHIIV